MPKHDPRIDAHIEKAAPFAKPILERIRAAMHAAVPDIEETIKWSMPFFEYKGTLATMAAFKAHVRFVFWKATLLGTKGIDRIESLSDLPAKKELIALIRKAAELNEAGVKVPRAPRAAAKTRELPAELAAALKKNRKAAAKFESFPPSHRAEYIDWIASAKRDETRQRRLEQAMEWIAEGKPQNWKYMEASRAVKTSKKRNPR